MAGAQEYTPHRQPLQAHAAEDAQLRAAERGPIIYSFVEKVIARLEDVIDQETAALRNHTVIDLKDFNNRKSHGLLELSRAMRLFEGTEVDKAIVARLDTLRAKLETNRGVLKKHLDAVREISTIVSDAIRDAESDGTYSRAIRRGGQP